MATLRSIQNLEWEDRYYGIAMRTSIALSLLITMAAFLFLPKEFAVSVYQMKKSVEMAIEALPPALEKMAEPPKAAKPATVPVAAAANDVDVQQTIETTTFNEVVKRTDETDIPVVPFWKVEIKPQPVDIPVPKYPEMARNAGIEGQTVVEALVNTDGSIGDARVLKSSGNQSLDAAAVEAAMRARFTPAKQRDKAVRVWVSIPFRFTLQG
jgi:protein TonB